MMHAQLSSCASPMLLKEINRQLEIIDYDSNVIQPFDRHASNLQDAVWTRQQG